MSDSNIEVTRPHRFRKSFAFDCYFSTYPSLNIPEWPHLTSDTTNGVSPPEIVQTDFRFCRQAMLRIAKSYFKYNGNMLFNLKEKTVCIQF